MLRAAVFDLDHTLFDPTTLPRALFGPLEARLADLSGLPALLTRVAASGAA